mgnify:CR=1 FL=1
MVVGHGEEPGTTTTSQVREEYVPGLLMRENPYLGLRAAFVVQRTNQTRRQYILSGRRLTSLGRR